MGILEEWKGGRAHKILIQFEGLYSIDVPTLVNYRTDSLARGKSVIQDSYL